MWRGMLLRRSFDGVETIDFDDEKVDWAVSGVWRRGLSSLSE